MALDTSDYSQEELNDYYKEQSTIRNDFQQSISTPAGMQAYNDTRDQRWEDIQNQTNGYEANGGGGFLGWLGDFMEPIMDTVIKYGPYVYAAYVGGAAAGLFGEAAGGAAAAAGGAAGAGEAALAGAALEGGAALGAGGAAAGAGAGAAAGGLGSMIGVAGGPMAVVGVGAPAAGAGLGLGGAALGGAGAIGLGSMLGGGTPDIPRVEIPGQRPPPEPTGGNIPIAPLPYLPPGSVQQGPVKDPIGAVTPGNMPTPPLPYLPPGSVQPGTNPSGTPPGGGLPGGIKDLLNGLGPILGGINDYKNSKEDQEWWKGQLDTLMGMYKPGTPEAGLMRSQMEAKDAAAGRNSQYGMRETNLAAMLAEKRAGIMTSGGYQNMANAYRNRSSQDLNSLFGAMGNTQTQNLIGSIGTGIGNLFK